MCCPPSLPTIETKLTHDPLPPVTTPPPPRPQVTPSQQFYDAYLYALFLPTATWPPYAVAAVAGQHGPWDALSVAAAPLRQAWGRINACMPWFCRWAVGWHG